jgi:predicted TIM-barrel fold metal-dependent hydrolase
MPAKQWMDDIQALASQPNIVAKISGIIAGIDKTKPVKDQLAPFVDHVWNSFGPDRVVFGGDWPVCLLGGSYATWVETLREIAAVRSAADQRKLFHDNAVRTYRLSV